MCRRVTCDRCGKPSWAGCGAHVEQVIGDVPKAERCRCRETAAQEKPETTSPAASGSWLDRLLGRK